MLYSERLKELEQEKAALVTQAELQRSILMVQLAGISKRVTWMQQIQGAWTQNRALLFPVAALAGFLAIRKGRTLFRWVPQILTVWRFVKPWLSRR